MTSQDHSPSVVERLTHTFSEWLRHRRELSEMRHLNAAEFDRIASDLRLSPADLDELVRHGPHAADELPRLLQALGISREDLARVEPMVRGLNEWLDRNGKRVGIDVLGIVGLFLLVRGAVQLVAG